LVHKTECLCVPGDSTLHSKAFAGLQYSDDVTQNWPSDDDIVNIEEMTQDQDQDLKFHGQLVKGKFKIHVIPHQVSNMQQNT
jgi:hypothetical protein